MWRLYEHSRAPLRLYLRRFNAYYKFRHEPRKLWQLHFEILLYKYALARSGIVPASQWKYRTLSLLIKFQHLTSAVVTVSFMAYRNYHCYDFADRKKRKKRQLFGKCLNHTRTTKWWQWTVNLTVPSNFPWFFLHFSDAPRNTISGTACPPQLFRSDKSK